jgi:hypothetical protein
VKLEELSGEDLEDDDNVLEPLDESLLEVKLEEMRGEDLDGADVLELPADSLLEVKLEELSGEDLGDEADVLELPADSLLERKLEELRDKDVDEDKPNVLALLDDSVLERMLEDWVGEDKEDDIRELDTKLEATDKLPETLEAELVLEDVKMGTLLEDFDVVVAEIADEDPVPAAQPNCTWLNCHSAVLPEKLYQTMELMALRFAPTKVLKGMVMVCVDPVSPDTV